MTTNDVDLIWSEIQGMKAELELLKKRRVILKTHADELEEMHETLTKEAERAERLVNQVREIL